MSFIWHHCIQVGIKAVQFFLYLLTVSICLSWRLLSNTACRVSLAVWRRLWASHRLLSYLSFRRVIEPLHLCTMSHHILRVMLWVSMKSKAAIAKTARCFSIRGAVCCGEAWIFREDCSAKTVASWLHLSQYKLCWDIGGTLVKWPDADRPFLVHTWK